MSQRASRLVSDNACIAVVDGKLTGRTRHNDRLLQTLLADSARSDEPVEQLFSRAANELPELFVRARSSTDRDSRVVAMTFRQLVRELTGVPDLTRLYRLTPTEQQITELMLQGLSVAAIAEKLHNSVLTVRTHIKRAYVKLNVGSKEQLFSTIIRLMVD
jgi:DNA-binding NarL/FixJ family response regulator